MNKDVSRRELTAMVKSAVAYGKSRAIPQTRNIMKLPAAVYIDPARFELEGRDLSCAGQVNKRCGMG